MPFPTRTGLQMKALLSSPCTSCFALHSSSQVPPLFPLLPSCEGVLRPIIFTIQLAFCSGLKAFANELMQIQVHWYLNQACVSTLQLCLAIKGIFFCQVGDALACSQLGKRDRAEFLKRDTTRDKLGGGRREELNACYASQRTDVCEGNITHRILSLDRVEKKHQTKQHESPLQGTGKKE